MPKPTIVMGMMLMAGLIFLVLVMLIMGQGIVTALGLWGLTALYVFLMPSPNTTLASWLFGVGLVTLLIQLVLELDGKKKDEKK